MRSHSYSVHLDAHEEIRLTTPDRGGNHVALSIEDTTLVLPLRNGADENVAFLRRLASEALTLAELVEAHESVSA